MKSWIGINLILLLGVVADLRAQQPVPDKLVVLTFDDSVRSHYTIVRPILKEFGFGATFFITEGFEFQTDKENYMTWGRVITRPFKAGFRSMKVVMYTERWGD